MNGLSDEFFSSPALAVPKHGGVCLRHQSDKPAHVMYLGTPPNDRWEVNICLYQVFAVGSIGCWDRGWTALFSLELRIRIEDCQQQEDLIYFGYKLNR